MLELKQIDSGLSFVTPLVLPGFEKNVPAGRIDVLAPTGRGAAEWFEDFVDDIERHLGRAFFPVYRMADGEFAFAVGPRPALAPRDAGLAELARASLRKIRHAARPTAELRTVWGEQYRGPELEELRSTYAEHVAYVARQGRIAAHFTVTSGRFAEQYTRPMLRWFTEHSIPLNENTYVPFYFVYAALRGPARRRLLANRRVLVFTGADEARAQAIVRGLEDEGVAAAGVYPISPTRSMFDVINLERIPLRPDVVLVAAGIGSVNILRQLAPLETVCIDAGACVDCLANPSRANRDFLVPDP